MDGWGIAEDPSVSAIDAANTPFYDYAKSHFSMARLEASGLKVGLPEGQMGNSEVGHMNIGAGRIVYQELVRLNLEIETGQMADNTEFKALVDYCETNQKPLHLMGLLSDGGVHSHILHLIGILHFLKGKRIPAVYIHAFTDGRDTAPQGGKGYFEQLLAGIADAGVGTIASVTGRYFAMDRDKRWPRVKKAYDAIVNGIGTPFTSPLDVMDASYAAGTTDEFVEPAVMVDADGQPVGKLQDGDAVLFFNFRTDRGRQLTHVLTQEDMPEEGMHTLKLYYATLTRYDDSFKDVHVLYEKDEIKNGLGEFLSNQGKQQIRIAETEKYPHVTFFFNGGREDKMPGETYMMCPSPKVATYDLQPTMSAMDIENTIIPELEKEAPDFVCLNFANPDMVGHTGVWEAAIKACETVDATTKAVTEVAVAHGYTVLITADHGNSDKMRNPDGTPHTAHTTALVPLFITAAENTFKLKPVIGKLGDLAPTILTIMGLPVPVEMTGDVLVEPV